MLVLIVSLVRSFICPGHFFVCLFLENLYATCKNTFTVPVERLLHTVLKGRSALSKPVDNEAGEGSFEIQISREGQVNCSYSSVDTALGRCGGGTGFQSQHSRCGWSQEDPFCL